VAAASLRRAAAAAGSAAGPGSPAAKSEAAAYRAGPQDSSLGRVYQMNELDQQPMPVDRPAPHYPDAAKAAGSSGESVIEFMLRPDGSTADVHPVSSSDPDFAAAAAAAVQQWKFQPGRKGGQPVGVLMQVPIIFTLGNDDGFDGSPDWF
jgi:protein TonB